MKQALRQLIDDFLSAIFFFAVYSLTGAFLRVRRLPLPSARRSSFV